MKRIFENNLMVLKYVVKFGKMFIVMCILSIGVEVFSDYIGMNISRWIFDNISFDKMKQMIVFILIIASISLVCNFVLQSIRTYCTQFEEMDIAYAMMGDVVNSAFDINQSRMEEPEFYDKYVRAISETNNRAREVIMTLRGLVYGIISLTMVLYLAIEVSLFVSISLLLSSMIGTIISYFANLIEYDRYMNNAKNERRYSYIVRLIFQPEYSKSIRMDGQNLNELVSDYLVENKKNTIMNIKKFYSKLFGLFSLTEISEFIFLRVIPWTLSIYYLYNGIITVGGASVLLSAVAMLPSVYGIIFNSVVLTKKIVYILIIFE